MYTPLPVLYLQLAVAGRQRAARLSPATAFGLTVVRTCSYGHDPESQRDTNDQVQDDDIRHHLEVVSEEILRLIEHRKPEGQHLAGKHKAQRITDTATSSSSSVSFSSSRPARAAAQPGPQRFRGRLSSPTPRGAARPHQGAHGEAAAATAGPLEAGLRGAR